MIKLITQDGQCIHAIIHWRTVSTPDKFEKINAVIDQIRKDDGFNADNVNAIVDALNDGNTSDKILYFNDKVCVVLSVYKNTSEDWIWMLSL